MAVFGETDSTYRIVAYTHNGQNNPLQEPHEGIALQRRSSLTSEWENGELKVWTCYCIRKQSFILIALGKVEFIRIGRL